MCGIAGYAGLHWPEILEPMSAATVHRGPDDGGVWHDAEALVGLAYRRLSIIDLSSAGHQPMCNGDRTVWISYNGEIYNFPEHRERLLEKDYRFRSHTDTEVIIALYEELGLDFLGELNGIFAFALWDAKSRRLLLARDHAGVKPLYYRSAGRKLYFASEIKALLSIPGFPRELHLPSVADYLTFLWVPGENTLLAAHNFLYTDKSSMAVSIEAPSGSTAAPCVPPIGLTMCEAWVPQAEHTGAPSAILISLLARTYTRSPGLMPSTASPAFSTIPGAM